MPLNRLTQTFDTVALKSVPNQYNNLLDFVSSTGATVASFSPNGLLDLRATNGTTNTADPSVIGDKIRLWGTDYGLGVQNSRLVLYNSAAAATAVRTSLTGSDVARFNNDGNISGRYFDSLGNTGSYLDMGTGSSGIVTINRVATHIPFTVRGAASQTANLQEWQNSASTPITVINSAGFLGAPRINFTGGTTTISALTLADGTVSFEGSAGQLFSVSNSLTGTIFSINDISGLPSVEVTDLGIVKLNELYGQTVVGSGTPVTSAQLSSIARTSTTIALAVKGAASQTANLQEWQNSSATILARIDSAGNATFTSIDGGTA